MSKFVKIINKDTLDNIKRFIEERQITKSSKTTSDELKELPDSSSKYFKNKRYLENHTVKFSKPFKIQLKRNKTNINKEKLLNLSDTDRVKLLIKIVKNKMTMSNANQKD